MATSPRHPRRALRHFLAAGAAIALLGAGAVALLALELEPGPDPAGAAAAGALPLPSPGAPPAPTAGALDPRAADPQATARRPAAGIAAAANGGLVTNPRPPPPAAAGAAPGDAGSASSPGAAPALTRTMPSRARYLVTSAIAEQVPGVAGCFAHAAPGFARRTALNRRSFVSGRGVLRLDLEPGAGELLVHDATVELAGNATDAELACARRALRGVALAVDGAAPGPRISMVYPIP